MDRAAAPDSSETSFNKRPWATILIASITNPGPSSSTTGKAAITFIIAFVKVAELWHLQMSLDRSLLGELDGPHFGELDSPALDHKQFIILGHGHEIPKPRRRRIVKGVVWNTKMSCGRRRCGFRYREKWRSNHVYPGKEMKELATWSTDCRPFLLRMTSISRYGIAIMLCLVLHTPVVQDPEKTGPMSARPSIERKLFFHARSGRLFTWSLPAELPPPLLRCSNSILSPGLGNTIVVYVKVRSAFGSGSLKLNLVRRCTNTCCMTAEANHLPGLHPCQNHGS